MTLGLFSLYFSFLLIVISGVAMSCNSSPRLPKSRFPHYRNSDVRLPKEIEGCDSLLDPTVSAFSRNRSLRLSMPKTSCQHKLRIPESRYLFRLFGFHELRCHTTLLHEHWNPDWLSYRDIPRTLGFSPHVLLWWTVLNHFTISQIQMPKCFASYPLDPWSPDMQNVNGLLIAATCLNRRTVLIQFEISWLVISRCHNFSVNSKPR